jgi:hypothetical protein
MTMTTPKETPKETLREQIREIGRMKINPHFVAAVDFPRIVSFLAEKAFIENWPDNSSSRAIRRAYELLMSQGFVSETEPAIGVWPGKP